MRKPHKQAVIAWILLFVFLIVAAGLAAALAIVFAPVNLYLEEDRYTLEFLVYEESGAFADLEKIALLDETNYSSERIRSYGGISKDFGTYENEEFGKHFRLTFWENKHNFILLQKKDGNVTIFNQKTLEDTISLYRSLEETYTAFLEKQAA